MKHFFTATISTETVDEFLRKDNYATQKAPPWSRKVWLVAAGRWCRVQPPLFPRSFSGACLFLYQVSLYALQTLMVRWVKRYILGKGSIEKKTFSFGHCPNYLNPPPMTPIRATWSSFFGSRNSRFESQFRT